MSTKVMNGLNLNNQKIVSLADGISRHRRSHQATAR